MSIRITRTLLAAAAGALCCLGTVAVAAPAAAIPTTATIHVNADTGHDSTTCGGTAAPCKTVAQGATRAQATLGDGATDVTIAVAAGTYHETVDIAAVPAGQSLTVAGDGAQTTTLDGNDTGTVVTVEGGTVTLSGLTIINGKSANGGGILDMGSLTVLDSVIKNNTSTGRGGGIYGAPGSSLTLKRSGVSNNEGASGGGIHTTNGVPLTVTDSVIERNHTDNSGGGIFAMTGTITRSTVTDNSADGSGGGISGNRLVLSASTVSGNSATNDGGGINVNTNATITNSTIAGNTATSGGGIYTMPATSEVGITASTVAGNAIASYNSTTVTASVLSDVACAGVTDGGDNVASDSSCVSDPTSVSATAASIGLAPLAANGSTGPKTMAIDENSAAHAIVPLAECSTTDGRGLPRPGTLGADSCDAGAYELQVPPASVPLPSTVPSGDGALSGVPASTHPGAKFTVTGTRFAPHAPVNFGFYSTPTPLASVTADASGTATTSVTVPDGLTGNHTVLAAGLGPNGDAVYLVASTTVTVPDTSTDPGTTTPSTTTSTATAGAGSGSTTPPASGTASSSGAPLADTGLPVDPWPLGLLAALLIVAGGVAVGLGYRRRPRHG